MRHLMTYGLAIALALFAVSAGAESAAPIDTAREGIFTPAYLLQSFVGLIIVIGLILILAMLFRRFGDTGMGAPGNMKVLGGLSVGQRERLVLVQVGTKQLLVGVSPGSVNQLMVFDEPLANTAPTNAGAVSAWQQMFKPAADNNAS